MDKQQLSKADIKRACDILRMDDGVGAGNYIEQLSWLLFLKVFENIEFELRELAKTESKEYKDIIETEYKWSTWAKKDWKDKDELVFFVNQKLFPYLRNLSGSPEKEKVAEIFREITNRIHSPHTLLDTVDILDSIKMEHFQDTHLLSQTYEEILQAMGSEGGWSGEFYTPRPIIRLMIEIINPTLGETVLDPFVGSAGFLVESFDHIISQNPKMGVKEWEQLQRRTFYGQEKKPLPFLIGMMNMILHRILVPNLIRTNTLMEDIHNMPENQKVDVVLTNPPFGGKENQAVQSNFPVPTQATEGLALQYVMRRLKNGGRCALVLPEGQILFGGGAFQAIREELLKKFNVTAVISLPQGTFAQMGAGVKTNLIFFEKTGPTKEIWFGEVEGKFTKKIIIKDSDLAGVFELYKNRKISSKSWVVSIDELEKHGYNISPMNPSVSSLIKDGSESVYSKLTKSQEQTSTLVNDLKATSKTSSFLHTLKKDLDEFKKIDEVFDLLGGGTPSKQNGRFWQNGTIKWVAARHVGNDHKIVAWDLITQEAVEKSTTSVIPKGSIILVTRVSLGKIVLTEDDFAINQDLVGLRPKQKNQVDMEYAFYALKQLSSKFIEVGRGASVKGVTRGYLKNLLIWIPDIETQRKVATELKNFYLTTTKIKHQLQLQSQELPFLEQAVLEGAFKK